MKRGILVPVLIENIKIPLEFRRIQAANVTNWKPSAPHPGFESLIASITTLVGSAAGDANRMDDVAASSLRAA